MNVVDNGRWAEEAGDGFDVTSHPGHQADLRQRRVVAVGLDGVDLGRADIACLPALQREIACVGNARSG